MAELSEALYSRLQAVSGVTALVGTRVYPLRLPQAVTYPAVRYQVIDEERPGALDADIGLVWARVQLDSYAATYLAAKQLATALRAALRRAAWTEDGVQVQDAELLVVQDETEELAPDRLVYRVRHDFRVCYRE